MCEITNGKIYVADRDLICYKVMFETDGQLESLHNRYEYEIGREYREKAFEYRCCMTDNIIYEVWNRNLSPFAGWRKDYTIHPLMYNDEIKTDLCYTRCGFYSYTYYRNGKMECDFDLAVKLYGSNRIKCVRCRIPEGSKYMVSDNGEVFISERIVIDDTLSL